MFENYKSKESPSYFVVANDGSYSSHSSCPPMGYECVVEGPENILFSCSERAKARGTECSLFAIGRKIVWKGSVSFRHRTRGYTAIITVSEFGNENVVYTGRGIKSGSGRAIELRFASCTGEANLLTNEWSVDACAGKFSAAGTIKAGVGRVSFSGYGADSNGKNVEIKLINMSGEARKSSFPATLSARALCQFALSKDMPSKKWETDPEMVEYVNETIRRGMSISECNEFAGNSPQSVTTQMPYKYSLQGAWEGVSDKVSGDILTDNNKSGGSLRLNVKQISTPCLGKWKWTKGKYGTEISPSGEWSVVCNQALSAAGTFRSLKRGHGKIEGEDNYNRKIYMSYN
ncbi:MAG: hypothetical protein HN578_03850 [Rhodospirillales bacterium]|nr:hypothetical protein [Rhodospirillales bacterium]